MATLNLGSIIQLLVIILVTSNLEILIVFNKITMVHLPSLLALQL